MDKTKVYFWIKGSDDAFVVELTESEFSAFFQAWTNSNLGFYTFQTTHNLITIRMADISVVTFSKNRGENNEFCEHSPIKSKCPICND
ncbi:MAG: hypothetical protein M0R38_12200 [Bacteroidia bacterium]|nr:hypothetical protein [Bacteroidia bacterium]